ncbi:MAG: hypothetical protein ACM3VW_02340 [Bacteroidota bacterium]
MPTVSGLLTHNGTHPAGARVDFRKLGVLIASVTTDANGNYSITLDLGNYTARVGTDLCTPNPIVVNAPNVHQDLLQA